VRGEVTTATVKKNWAPPPANITIYNPDIRYRYSARGKSFEGSKLSYLNIMTFTKRSAEQVVQRFSIGQEVSVYYHPHRPSEAVLVPGISSLALSAFISLNVILVLFMFINDILNYFWPGCLPACA
jgi:hypothetical protein